MWLLCFLAVWQRSIPICPLIKGLLEAGGEREGETNRKPSLLSMNNSKVNCLLLVSSLNFNTFITYKCTIVSPPWQHLSLYGVICLSKKIMLFWTCCIFGRSLELLGMQLLFNWDQQPVLAWSQSWASSHVCWSLGMKEQMAKSSTSRSDPQGMFFLYLGTVLAQKTGFPFSYQKKKLLVIHTNRKWVAHVGTVHLPSGCL